LMEAEFGLSDIQLGWAFSSFVLGYALFQAPGGRMADRFGARQSDRPCCYFGGPSLRR
jgi:ACS family glucarate transporter-like MFS transporter